MELVTPDPPPPAQPDLDLLVRGQNGGEKQMPVSLLHRPASASTRQSSEPARPVSVTVHAGQTLWGLAASHHMSVAALESHNTIPDPNYLLVGETLFLLGAHHRPLAAPQRPAVTQAHAVAVQVSSSPQEAAQPVSHAVQASAESDSDPSSGQAAAPVQSWSGVPAWFTACVIARESGGNPQVMNSSGHYGLFQFSYSTWVLYGGAPGAFGDASVAEQYAVFDAAYAASGTSNWQPWDGC